MGGCGWIRCARNHALGHVAQVLSVFGLGLSTANVHKFWGFWGPFGGGLRTYCGVGEPRGPFSTGKSSGMCRVATISLCWAIFSRFQDGFGKKKEAHFGPKLQISKLRFGTCDAPPVRHR